MGFLSKSEVNRIMTENRKEANSSVAKSMIIGVAVAVVLIFLAPIMKQYALFIGISLGAFSFFIAHLVSLYIIDLKKKLRK